MKCFSFILLSFLSLYCLAENAVDLDEFMHIHNLDDDNFQRMGERVYKLKGATFPWQLKCSDFDKRIIHGCIKARFFDASSRVYFDSGKDSQEEIDIFNDGGVNISVDLASIYFPWRLGMTSYFDSWSWGPVFSAGIGSPAQDSEDGNVEASSAPVVLFSNGISLEYTPEKSGPSIGLELGRAIGVTSDESFGDNSDSGWYVGFKITM